jgi:Domain of unknown function (DUF4440)
MGSHDVSDVLDGADPIELERQGWRALATSGQAAAAFYRDVLDVNVAMLLPGGTMLEDRETVIRSMSGPPWSDYQLDDVRALTLTDDVSVVTYGVTAQRARAPRYSALINSTYVRRPDGWKLAVHQQTPH